MKEIKLYIATSIDGYIARENDSLDWLYETPTPEGEDYQYAEFLATIDTVVLGRKTYEQILNFGGEWPYKNCKSYIVTRDKNYTPKTHNTEVINSIDLNSINQIKSLSNKSIWVIGGGHIITELLNKSAIDEMILTIIPRILSKGIRLFPNHPKETKFKLLEVKPFKTGLVNLTYRRLIP